MRSDAVTVARQMGAVLGDFSTSEWLRNALRSSLDSDPLDAAIDAEVLAQLLRDRADILIKGELSGETRATGNA